MQRIWMKPTTKYVLQRRIYITLTQHSHTGDTLITGGAAAALENTLLKFVK